MPAFTIKLYRLGHATQTLPAIAARSADLIAPFVARGCFVVVRKATPPHHHKEQPNGTTRHRNA